LLWMIIQGRNPMSKAEITLHQIEADRPWDVGYALGVALRTQIAAIVEDLPSYEVFRVQQPWWMPYSFYARLSEWRAHDLLRPSIAATYPELEERIAGMAAAVGVRVETLYLFHALEAMYTSFDAVECALPLAGCSALAANGLRTSTGEPMVQHNFDNVSLRESPLVLRERREAGKYRSIEFGIAPLSGAIDGINEYGLAITYNFAWTTEPGPPAPPVSMAISQALDSCRDVGEAVRFITRRVRCGGSMLMLADASGQVARLELSGKRLAVERLQNSEGYLFHSNTYRSAALKEIEVSPETRFSACAPQPLQGQRVLESAEKRDARMAELMPSRFALTPDDLAQLMADHGTDEQPDGNTICMHGDHWSTLAALQFFPRRRMVRVAWGPACAAIFAEFAL
jgi:hypothetical protein